MANTALAQKILNILEVRPEMHDQCNWFAIFDDALSHNEVDAKALHIDLTKDNGDFIKQFEEEEVQCGATLCVAGWAAVLSGYKLKNERNANGYYYPRAVLEGESEENSKNIQHLGAELLDIPTEDADRLFTETDDEQAIVALRQIAEGRDIDWYAVGLDDDNDDDDQGACDCGCNDYY